MLKSQSCKVVTFFKNDTDWLMIVSKRLWPVTVVRERRDKQFEKR